ncbi:FecCD family ABC transporter permease [Pseudooceanicola aestuarii]|uniref:FecCD family ABC transporter permease n=1 Tax=Pseudooceanicola aestuarii TaxID=2697319 RepID=UPI0013D56FB3|nr:iron ABC transporter permease [Pseudooceanicola aestuarii]
MPRPALIPRLAALRRRRRRGHLWRCALLAALLLAAFVSSLMVGQSYVPPATLLRILAGQDVPGAGFIVETLRLPRATLAVLTGASFGMAGAAFQTLLRNPLASPDIVGITAGASTGAVFGIIVLGLRGTDVSLLAVSFGLLVALAIYGLAWKNGVSGVRLILIGIGISAMLQSGTNYLLSRALAWDLQEAFRWLTGSLNGAAWSQILPVAAAAAICMPLLLGQSRNLATLRLGEELAVSLGIRTGWARLVVVLAAVGLVSFATAATGPISFVAFLAGPIAARITGPGGGILIPAALTGALLVLGADFIGQNAFSSRYPVGVVTGVLGAPYLIYLITRSNRGKGRA